MQLLVSVTGYLLPVCIMQVSLLVQVWTCGFNLFLKWVIDHQPGYRLFITFVTAFEDEEIGTEKIKIQLFSKISSILLFLIHSL